MSDTVSRTIGALQAAGFRGERLKTAFGIVMRESGGNPRAHNPNRATGDDSYGLAQINMLGPMGAARRRQFGIRSNEQLYDPNVNARAMFQMSKGGKDFGAWGIGPHAYRQGAGYDTIARYVNQFPGAHPAGGTGPVARAPSSPLPPVPPSLSPQAAARRAYGLALLAQIVARRGGSPLMRTVLARAAEQPDEQPPPKQPPPPRSPQARPVARAPRAATATPPPGGIRELFYDPIGAYDEGKWIAPIGGHSDHVHFSFGNPQAAIQIIDHAKAMGLRTTENPYAEGSMPEAGVHVADSYHYRDFKGRFTGGRSPILGEALDVSGDPAKMAALFRWARRRYLV